ncbi:hypothetical protein FB451DRAFT_1470615 [Mycena latifolia]|nr:hypothetical protein FB451DRAFT_1470615 [Mycena latifolia]
MMRGRTQGRCPEAQARGEERKRREEGKGGKKESTRRTVGLAAKGTQGQAATDAGENEGHKANLPLFARMKSTKTNAWPPAPDVDDNPAPEITTAHAAGPHDTATKEWARNPSEDRLINAKRDALTNMKGRDEEAAGRTFHPGKAARTHLQTVAQDAHMHRRASMIQISMMVVAREKIRDRGARKFVKEVKTRDACIDGTGGYI